MEPNGCNQWNGPMTYSAQDRAYIKNHNLIHLRPMKRILPASLLLCLLLSLTSCIEFESQELTYRHDQEEDALLVTLRYEGIFGSTESDGFDRSDPANLPPEENLSQKQVQQLDSVLTGNRAFFFSNWIFEYDRAALEKMLAKGKTQPIPDGKAFGEPERKLLEALIKDVKIENVGFYKDGNDRLCAAQTLKVSNVSKVLSLTNEVIGRQLRANLPEMREGLKKGVKSAMSQKTIDLIAKKTKGRFEFITFQGNQISLQFPMTKEDAERVAKDVLKGLPKDVRVSQKGKRLTIEIGDADKEAAVIAKECFSGYCPNALNYLKKEHPKLFLKPEQLEKALVRFLSN